MGYRSDVVIIIEKGTIPAFLTLLCKEENNEAKELVFHHRDEFDDDFGKAGHMLVRWNSIKWYDSYSCVSALCGFLMENEETTRFVRCGEEGEDVECMGDFMEWEVRPVVENYIEFEV